MSSNFGNHTASLSEIVRTSVCIYVVQLIHIKGTWSVHLFNGDYLSIPETTGSCWSHFHEIPGIKIE